MKSLAFGLLLGSLLAGGTQWVFAQEGIWPPEPELLHGGSGLRSVVAVIHQRLVYPPEARMACIEGRVFVTFSITPTGKVQQVKVVKPLWAPFDSAAVKVIRQLRFKPMPQQQGATRYVVPVNYQIYEDSQAAKKARRRNSTR